MTKCKVYRQDWEESERGWGVHPDGYSLHAKLAHVDEYTGDYWMSMPDETPDEYSRPVGSPFPIEVDQQVFDQIKTSKNGVRYYR